MKKLLLIRKIKKTQKVFIKKTNENKKDVKVTSTYARQKHWVNDQRGQLKKKLGKATGRPEPRTIPKRNRNGKQGIGRANNYEYIPLHQ